MQNIHHPKRNWTISIPNLSIPNQYIHFYSTLVTYIRFIVTYFIHFRIHQQTRRINWLKTIMWVFRIIYIMCPTQHIWWNLQNLWYSTWVLYWNHGNPINWEVYSGFNWLVYCQRVGSKNLKTKFHKKNCPLLTSSELCRSDLSNLELWTIIGSICEWQ